MNRESLSLKVVASATDGRAPRCMSPSESKGLAKNSYQHGFAGGSVRSAIKD